MQLTFVPKIVMMSVGTIQCAPFNPENRTEENERLKNLMQGIKDLGGIVYPLIVSSDNRLIDGHRRLACAKKLGIKEVPCIVLPLELQRAWIVLNDTQLPIMGGGWTEIVYHGVAIANLPTKQRRALQQIYDLVGDEGIEAMATKTRPMSPHVLSWAKRICRYIDDTTDEMIGITLLWLVEHNMQKPARFAMENGVPPQSLARLIKSNKPIKQWDIV